MSCQPFQIPRPVAIAFLNVSHFRCAAACGFRARPLLSYVSWHWSPEARHTCRCPRLPVHFVSSADPNETGSSFMQPTDARHAVLLVVPITSQLLAVLFQRSGHPFQGKRLLRGPKERFPVRLAKAHRFSILANGVGRESFLRGTPSGPPSPSVSLLPAVCNRAFRPAKMPFSAFGRISLDEVPSFCGKSLSYHCNGHGKLCVPGVRRLSCAPFHARS